MSQKHTVDIVLTDKTNIDRGRNGYFTPNIISVLKEINRIGIRVYSRQFGKCAPIILRLTATDAKELASAINEITGQE